MQEQEADEEINLIPYLKTAWNGVLRIKWFLIALIIISMVITSVVSARLTKYYRAEAVFVTTGSEAGGLGALAGIFGGSASSSSDNLMVFLTSRTTAENVVSRLNLMKIFYRNAWDETTGTWKNPNNPPQLADAAMNLKGITTFKKNKDGSYLIRVEWKDPVLVADIANHYVIALTDSLNNNAVNTTIRVVDKALPAAGPYTPDVDKNVKIAGVISLLAGIFVAYVIESRREKKHSA